MPAGINGFTIRTNTCDHKVILKTASLFEQRFLVNGFLDLVAVLCRGPAGLRASVLDDFWFLVSGFQFPVFSFRFPLSVSAKTS